MFAACECMVGFALRVRLQHSQATTSSITSRVNAAIIARHADVMFLENGLIHDVLYEVHFHKNIMRAAFFSIYFMQFPFAVCLRVGSACKVFVALSQRSHHALRQSFIGRQKLTQSPSIFTQTHN